MVFIKLLAVLALLLTGVILLISLPQIYAKRLTETGSKYRELPICILTVFLIIGVVCYCILKNTFWGFIAVWSTIYIFFCQVVTIIRFYVGQCKYCRKYYVKYSLNWILLSNFMIIILLGGVIRFSDYLSAKFPDSDSIESVYFSCDDLQPQTEDGVLSPEYAIIHREDIPDMVEKNMGLKITEKDADALAQNLKLAATNIRTDEDGFTEILTLCQELNHGFLQQEFSRQFKTTENKEEKYYCYVTFRLKNGRIIHRRYEYGQHNIELSENDRFSMDTLQLRVDQLQQCLELPTCSIQKAGLFYRINGETAEQFLPQSSYNTISKLIKKEKIKTENQQTIASMTHMCVYVVYSYTMPSVYKVFGIEDRHVTEYYTITKGYSDAWNYFSDLLLQ